MEKPVLPKLPRLKLLVPSRPTSILARRFTARSAPCGRLLQDGSHCPASCQALYYNSIPTSPSCSHSKPGTRPNEPENPEKLSKIPFEAAWSPARSSEAPRVGARSSMRPGGTRAGQQAAPACVGPFFNSGTLEEAIQLTRIRADA